MQIPELQQSSTKFISPPHTPHASSTFPAQSTTAVELHALSHPLNTALPPHIPAQSKASVQEEGVDSVELSQDIRSRLNINNFKRMWYYAL